MDLTVQLNKVSYFPGETVKAFVRVAHAKDDPVSTDVVENVTVIAECSGSEKTDSGWLASLYKPTTPGKKEAKRTVRTIFTCNRAVLMRTTTEPAGYQRGFSVRFRLPTRIPPTYKGNSTRFQYQVLVRSSCSIAGVVRAAQAQASFSVWPLSERPHGVERRTAAGSEGAQEEQELDVIEYRLEVQEPRTKWEEVTLLPDGAPAALQSGPSMALSLLDTQESAELDQGEASTSGDAAATAAADAEQEDGPAGLRQLAQVQQASMAPRTFNLRAGDHPLCRITLQPPLMTLLVPGSTLGVLLDFGMAHGAGADRSVQPQCSQVTVMLESEEVVHPPYGHKQRGGEAALRKLHCEQQQVTERLLACSFVFSVPPHACPSFRTPMVSHRWLLRFELSLVVPRGGTKVATEQLVWTLPLVVLPPPWA